MAPQGGSVPRHRAARAFRHPRSLPANPIGLSVVNLLTVDGNVLSIENLDLLDGTPVLDIKPFVGEFDARTEIRTGWLEAARHRRDRADDRFSD